MQHLPTAEQRLATEGFFQEINSPTRTNSRYLPDTLRELHRLGLLEGFEEHAVRSFAISGDESDPIAVATGWREWALELPADGPTGAIREQALRRWIGLNPSAWRDIVSTVPPEASDIFHARAAASLPGDEGDLAAERIGSPELREQVQRYRSAEINTDDPFADNPVPSPWWE